MNEFHNDPHAMARVLVQYIPSNLKVQREIAANLGHHLCLSTIVSIRAAHNNATNRKGIRDFDKSVVWMDERHENTMDAANRNFVAALTLARAA